MHNKVVFITLMKNKKQILKNNIFRFQTKVYNLRNKKCFLFLLVFIFVSNFDVFSQETNSQNSNDAVITGVWENPSRFLYLSNDGKSQLVLKPYYGYLYEPFPLKNAKIISASSFLQAIENVNNYDNADNQSKQKEVSEIKNNFVNDKNFFSKILKLQYSLEKTETEIPCMVTKDGIFFDFLNKLIQNDSSPNASEIIQNIDDDKIKNNSNHNKLNFLEGFWIATGGRSSILLYNEKPTKEVYCWFFTDSQYCRIRYWLVESPFSDKIAEIQLTDSDNITQTITFPRLLEIESEVYTCVTLNDSIVRHYESGTYEILQDNKIKCTPKINSRYKPNPNRELFTGETTIPFYFDETKTLLALDKPSFIPYELNDNQTFDDVVSEHNKQRRPAREPLIPLMKLDFHWEEVERLRKKTTK